jgi:hypothetical protein
MPPDSSVKFSDWWKFETEIVSFAWKSTNKIRSIFWSMVSAMLITILQFSEAFRSKNETWISIINIIGVAVVVFLIQFLIHLIRSSVLLHQRAAKAADDSKRELADFKEQRKPLEIEIISRSSGNYQANCEINVHNPNPTKGITGVRLRLLHVEPLFHTFHTNYLVDAMRWSQLKFASDDIGGNTINGDMTASFPIFVFYKAGDRPALRFIGQLHENKSDNGTWDNLNYFSVESEHIFSFEVTGDGIHKNEKRFKVCFAKNFTKPLVTCAPL